MYKTILIILMIAISNSFASTVKQLPEPDKTGGQPLMKVLNERQTSRTFNKKEINEKILSNILWAGFGINRSNNKRTAPTALNSQDIELYVVKKDGTWLYNAKNNTLELIIANDLTKYFSGNPVLTIVYVVDNGKSKGELYSAMHIGSIYQNVGLYCASEGLNNVVRAYFNKEKFAKELNLKNKTVLISQSISLK